MTVLSLTFHCISTRLQHWEKYVNETLVQLTENLMDVDQYILSEVESDYVAEGKNYNLLLIFASEELRNDFLESELKNISERIEKEFQNDVMVFQTNLKPLKDRMN